MGGPNSESNTQVEQQGQVESTHGENYAKLMKGLAESVLGGAQSSENPAQQNPDEQVS